MKNIFILLFALLCTLGSFAQADTTNPTIKIATRIAKKMKDSLALTEAQRTQIYKLNLQVQNHKSAMWHMYSNRDSILHHVQRIENTRDSLYKPLLTGPQYLLYIQKRKNLVTSN